MNKRQTKSYLPLVCERTETCMIIRPQSGVIGNLLACIATGAVIFVILNDKRFPDYSLAGFIIFAILKAAFVLYMLSAVIQRKSIFDNSNHLVIVKSRLAFLPYFTRRTIPYSEVDKLARCQITTGPPPGWEHKYFFPVIVLKNGKIFRLSLSGCGSSSQVLEVLNQIKETLDIPVVDINLDRSPNAIFPWQW